MTLGLFRLDLDKIKSRAEEVANHWNGSDLNFIGADGEPYTDEDAQVMSEIVNAINDLDNLLKEANHLE